MLPIINNYCEQIVSELKHWFKSVYSMIPIMHNHHPFKLNGNSQKQSGEKEEDREREKEKIRLRERETEHRRDSKMAWVEK